MKLGVNIDHVATLRQARGTTYPDPLDAAMLCAQAGAQGITAHLREDRRHMQDEDICRLKEMQPLPLNLEIANVESIIEIALEIKPPEVCIVPEKRQELTTEGGLSVTSHFEALHRSVQLLRAEGIEVSLFVDADEETLIASRDTGSTVVELHTGSCCDASPSHRPLHLERLVQGAEYAHGLGLKVNAGHGITYDSIADILRIPHLDTLNIGHSIVSRAVMQGMKAAVEEMLAAMQEHEG